VETITKDHATWRSKTGGFTPKPDRRSREPIMVEHLQKVISDDDQRRAGKKRLDEVENGSPGMGPVVK